MRTFYKPFPLLEIAPFLQSNTDSFCSFPQLISIKHVNIFNTNSRSMKVNRRRASLTNIITIVGFTDRWVWLGEIQPAMENFEMPFSCPRPTPSLLDLEISVAQQDMHQTQLIRMLRVQTHTHTRTKTHLTPMSTLTYIHAYINTTHVEFLNIVNSWKYLQNQNEWTMEDWIKPKMHAICRS